MGALRLAGGSPPVGELGPAAAPLDRSKLADYRARWRAMHFAGAPGGGVA